MNKKIKELAIKAGAENVTRCVGHGEYQTELTLSNNEVYGRYNIDKFAELIIKECVNISESDPECCTNTALRIANSIKQHFGVE